MQLGEERALAGELGETPQPVKQMCKTNMNSSCKNFSLSMEISVHMVERY